MRRAFALAVATGLVGLFGAWAGEPDDQYLGICNLIREADALLPAPRTAEALPKYNEAQEALRKLQRDYPDWNSEAIRYRLGYLTNRLAKLASQTAAGGTPGPRAAKPPAAATFVDWEAQLASLQEQVRQLQGDKTLLEAKLKEALAVLPSAADPREMARLQTRLDALEKENALLAATVAQLRAQAASTSGFFPLATTAAPTNLDLLLQAERERMKALDSGKGGTNAPAAHRWKTIVTVDPGP